MTMMIPDVTVCELTDYSFRYFYTHVIRLKQMCGFLNWTLELHLGHAFQLFQLLG